MKAYPTYKDSGVQWLGNIPTHWKIVKLRNLLHKTTQKGRPDLPLLSVVREQGVILRDVESKEENHNYIPDDLSNYKVLRDGQFVINKMKAWQGSYSVSSLTGIVSPAYFIYDVGYTDLIPQFFNTAIRSRAYIGFFNQASDGVRIGQWDLDEAQMRNIPLFVPSIEEQNAIVAYLDKKCAEIDELVSRRLAIIERLKELKQSIIAEAVTKGLNPDVPMKDSGIAWLGDVPKHWKILRLKNVASVITDTLSEKTNPDFEFDYVDISSVTQEQGILKTERFKFSNAPSRARRKVQVGDIIISTVRTYLRAIAVISKENENIIASTGFAVVRSKQFSYVAYVMSSHSFVSMVSTLSTGVSYPAITSNKLLRIHIAFPPEEEQQAIVAYLDKKCAEIDELVVRQEQIIEKLKELKTSTIAHVVTGKVDVRDAI